MDYDLEYPVKLPDFIHHMRETLQPPTDHLISLSLSLSLYIYIYIDIHTHMYAYGNEEWAGIENHLDKSLFAKSVG